MAESSDSVFFRNTLIVIGLIVVLAGVAAWRIGARGKSSDTTAETEAQAATNVSNEQTIQVASLGYRPQQITVQQGKPVKLNLVTNNTSGCIRSFIIPTLGISKTLPATGSTTIEFTPTQKGQVGFSCSMGMFTGTINVI